MRLAIRPAACLRVCERAQPFARGAADAWIDGPILFAVAARSWPSGVDRRGRKMPRKFFAFCRVIGSQRERAGGRDQRAAAQNRSARRGTRLAKSGFRRDANGRRREAGPQG